MCHPACPPRASHLKQQHPNLDDLVFKNNFFEEKVVNFKAEVSKIVCHDFTGLLTQRGRRAADAGRRGREFGNRPDPSQRAGAGRSRVRSMLRTCACVCREQMIPLVVSVKLLQKTFTWTRDNWIKFLDHRTYPGHQQWLAISLTTLIKPNLQEKRSRPITVSTCSTSHSADDLTPLKQPSHHNTSRHQTHQT